MYENTKKSLTNIFVGARLLKMTDREIVIQRGKEIYVLTYEIDDDGCSCTYAEVYNSMIFDGENTPIITNINFSVCEDDYCEESCKITFFGEDRAIAEANYRAGSSGYRYGSTVTLVCKELNIREVIVEY